MSKKIFNLKREIREAQSRRSISQIADIRVCFDDERGKVVEKIIDKVADLMFRPILFKECDVDEKLNIVSDLCSDKDNISVSFSLIGSACYKKNVLTSSIYRHNYTRKNRPEKATVINFTGVSIILSDKKGNRAEVISVIDAKLNKKVRGAYKYCMSLYYSRNEAFIVCDMAVLLSEIYIANQLHKYVENDIDMKTFVLLNECNGSPVFKSAESIDYLNKLNIKYNLPLLNIKSVKLDNNYLHKQFLLLVAAVENSTIFNLSDLYHGYNDIKAKMLKFNVVKLMSDCKDMFYLYLRNMSEDNEEIYNDAERRHKIAEDYATSYMTKKNIPLKIQARMSNNKFLKWFGYVELDELVDLKKISQIEDEFVDFAERLNLPLVKDHSLRFRRLGHHRASGLYYPGVNSVCIDLEGLYSIGHECMHMVDYTSMLKTKLSDLYNFKSVIDCYKRIVENDIKKLPDNSLTKMEFYGKNKYNKKYYFCNTEIFARCGEIYLKKVLKFDNSIVQYFEPTYYPNDPGLLLLIQNYFKSIFSSFPVIIEEKKVVGGSRLIFKEHLFDINLRECQNGQLSLI